MTAPNQPTGQFPNEFNEADILAKVRSLTPREFEEFVAVLWELQGWTTQVTDEGADGGVDIFAKQVFPVDLEAHIQAKRYGEDKKIGGREVREYALWEGANADFPVVITSGSFTSGKPYTAVWEANDKKVKLIDGEKLALLIWRLNADKLLDEFLQADDVTQINVEKYIPENEFAGAVNDSTEPSTQFRHTPEETEAEDIGESVEGKLTNRAAYLKKPVTVVRGIGTNRAERLSKAGIETLEDLATVNPEKLAAETRFGKPFIEKIIDRANKLPDRPVDSIRGIGTVRAEQLAVLGIETRADLATANLEEVAEETQFSIENLKKLIEKA